MKKNITHLKILIFVFIAISCGDNQKEISFQKLQGDWLYNNVEGSKEFISFRDSLFFGREYYNEFQPFCLKEDSVIIPSYNIRFKYTRVTDKYIWIEKNNKEIPLFIATSYNRNYNLKLVSLEIRFKNFGNRALFDWGLFLDKDLNCFFKVEHAKVYKNMKNPLPYQKGIYYTKMSQTVFDFYQNKFRNVPLNLVQETYSSDEYTAGPSCVLFDKAFIQFECIYGFNNSDKIKAIRFIAKGYKNIPDFLSAFIIHLNKIHDLVKFTDSKKTHEFKFYGKDEYFKFIE